MLPTKPNRSGFKTALPNYVVGNTKKTEKTIANDKQTHMMIPQVTLIRRIMIPSDSKPALVMMLGRSIQFPAVVRPQTESLIVLEFTP